MEPDNPRACAESTPRPTYAPIAMALGVSMTVWGLMAISLNINALWSMSLAGAGVAAWALKHWIDEIVAQWEDDQ